MVKIRATTVLTLTQNIVWATICVVLAFIICYLLLTNNKLQQQAEILQRQAITLHQPPCVARDPWAAGTSRKFTVESDGLQRSYIVHLPTSFKSTTIYPAVVYFSGKGSGAADSDRYSGYNKLPAIAIYPQPTIGKDGVLSWQSAPYSSGINDVAFVGHMLDQVSGQLCINRAHIYAVGVSNGGGMVALLSCRMPDRIRAFGMIAGAYYPQSNCKPKKPAPIITIHGDGDKVVPYFGSVARKLPDIDEWSARRASQNICQAKPLVSHQPSSVITSWSQCSGGATVYLVRQIGAGHAWTPAERDIIWQFLSSY